MMHGKRSRRPSCRGLQSLSKTRPPIYCSCKSTSCRRNTWRQCRRSSWLHCRPLIQLTGQASVPALDAQQSVDFTHLAPSPQAVSTEKAGYSGVVALLHSGSALKPQSVTVGLGGQGFVSEGRALTLRYPNFFVCSVYSPNSGEGLKRLDYRLKEWEPALGAHLRTLDAEAPVLLLGDLNVAHLDSDIWNVGAKHLPKSAGTTPEERAAFSTLLSTNRLVDVFRHFFPTACGCFTYWSQRAGNRPFNRGLRLDYSLASSRLLEATDGLRVSDALLLPSEATLGLSDHGPVGCVLSGV